MVNLELEFIVWFVGIKVEFWNFLVFLVDRLGYWGFRVFYGFIFVEFVYKVRGGGGD